MGLDPEVVCDVRLKGRIVLLTYTRVLMEVPASLATVSTTPPVKESREEGRKNPPLG